MIVPAYSRPVWVLGGGGVAGIAWEIGLLAGLEVEGVTVSPDSTVIGTSAGAAVGAQLDSGITLPELYDRQQHGVPYETAEGLSVGELLRITRASLFSRTPIDAGRRIGKVALRGTPADPGLLRRTVEARLPKHEWGETQLWAVAVDVESGTPRVFTRADGVALVDAVAASCAVPLSSTPVVIEGRPYMDGGMRSTLNLDLAPGNGPVIALAPSTTAIGTWARIDAQRATLVSAGRRVEITYRDQASKRAQGRTVMDRAIVPALAAAGREQGRREALRVAAALVVGDRR